MLSAFLALALGTVEKQYNPIEDGKINYLTVICQEDSYLHNWFDNSNSLQKYRQASHFHYFDFNSPIYRERFHPYVGGRQTILVQDQSGKILLKVSGNNIPNNSEALSEILASCDWVTRPRACPWRQSQPEPQPQPEPSPLPVLPLVDVDVIPDTPINDEPPLWLLIVSGLAGVGLGSYSKLKENV